MMDSFFPSQKRSVLSQKMANLSCISIFRKHSEKDALRFHGESEVFIFES